MHLIAPGLEVVKVDASWIMPGDIETHLPENYELPPSRDTYVNGGIVE